MTLSDVRRTDPTCDIRQNGFLSHCHLNDLNAHMRSESAWRNLSARRRSETTWPGLAGWPGWLGLPGLACLGGWPGWLATLAGLLDLAGYRWLASLAWPGLASLGWLAGWLAQRECTDRLTCQMQRLTQHFPKRKGHWLLTTFFPKCRRGHWLLTKSVQRDHNILPQMSIGTGSLKSFGSCLATSLLV